MQVFDTSGHILPSENHQQPALWEQKAIQSVFNTRKLSLPNKI